MDEPKAVEPELDEEDEWQLYASAGYASTGFILEETETVEDKQPDDVCSTATATTSRVTRSTGMRHHARPPLASPT